MAVNTKTCTVKPSEIIDYLDYKNGDNPKYGPVKAMQMEKHLDVCLLCVRRIDQLMGMENVDVFTDSTDRGEWIQWLKSSVAKLRWNDQILPICKGSKLEKDLIEAQVNFVSLKGEDNKDIDNAMVYISGQILKSLYRREIYQKMASVITGIQILDLSARKTVIGSQIGSRNYVPGTNVILLLKVAMPYGDKLYLLADQLRSETHKFIAKGLGVKVEKIDIEIVDVIA